ncbi:MAG: LamG domain-containing protein [Chitinispirillaceae bacterium]|nr:LamG domain-containing protein [Chitinispirillaceae bacterium]
MKKVLAIAVAVLFVMSCTQSPTPFSFNGGNSRSAEIWDGAHNTETGNNHFYFLPPMVKTPSTSGVFDASLSPVVEVLELEGVPGSFTPSQTVVFSASGSDVSVNTVDELYQVNWKTSLSNLDADKFYRISVFVSGTVLGFADVDVCNTGKEFKNVNTDEFIPLNDDRTLPIKFRIEEGAVSAFPPEGLIAWYKGDGNTDDAMGIYNGFWTDGVSSYSEGKKNQAFNCYGDWDNMVSYSIRLPDEPSAAFDFGPESVFSCACWMKTSFQWYDYPGLAPVVGRGVSNTLYWSWGINIRFHDYIDQALLAVGTHGKDIESEHIIMPNTWYHVTYTYNKGVHKVYLDGQPVSLNYAGAPYSDQIVEIYESDAPTQIGSRFVLDDGGSPVWMHNFQGQIDEVMFFNRELTAAEAQVLAQQ